MLMHWPKEGAKITKTHFRETSYHSIKLRLKQVFQCSQTWSRDKVIPKTMEARNSQKNRLSKKKGSCRISIVRWACLFG